MCRICVLFFIPPHHPLYALSFIMYMYTVLLWKRGGRRRSADDPYPSKKALAFCLPLSLSSAQNIAEENEKREEEDRWLLGLLGGAPIRIEGIATSSSSSFFSPLVETGPGNNKDVPQRSQHSTKKNSSDGGGQWECSIHGRATISTLFFHFLSRLQKYLMAPEFSG